MVDPIFAALEKEQQWRSNMLSSPAVRAMLQRTAAETPLPGEEEERPRQSLTPSPYLDDFSPDPSRAASPPNTGLAAPEPGPSALIVVEMHYHPASKRGSSRAAHFQAGGRGLESASLYEDERSTRRGATSGYGVGASIAHDPDMYERYFRRLVDAFGEGIQPPNDTGHDGRASQGSYTRAIPAKVVRASAVPNERFDPFRAHTYPRDLDRGFLPTNLSFTGPASSQLSARTSRLGAFEVYLIVNHVPVNPLPGQSPRADADFRTAVAGLHSKLYMRHFPKISTLVQRCQELLAPIFLAQQEKEEARQGREASMEARA